MSTTLLNVATVETPASDNVKPPGPKATAGPKSLCDAPVPYVKIPGEEWRNVPGFPALQASSLGRIRQKASGRILPITSGPSYEYPRLTLHGDGKARTVEVHRLVGLAFFGPLAPKMQIHHIDHDKNNCAVTNLRVVSQSENMAEATRAGRTSRKLQPRDVQAIRALVAASVPIETVATAFSVKPQTITKIAAGRSWRAIPNETKSQAKNLPLDFMEQTS